MVVKVTSYVVGERSLHFALVTLAFPMQIPSCPFTLLLEAPNWLAAHTSSVL